MVPEAHRECHRYPEKEGDSRPRLGPRRHTVDPVREGGEERSSAGLRKEHDCLAESPESLTQCRNGEPPEAEHENKRPYGAESEGKATFRRNSLNFQGFSVL
jgi:hypothetical protein